MNPTRATGKNLAMLYDYTSDDDKDSFPNIIDCSPSNPKKQGLKEFVGGLKKRYEEHKAKEPERRAVDLERMKHKLEIQKLKEEQFESRARVRERQIGLQHKSAELRYKESKMYGRGQGEGSPSLMGPPLMGSSQMGFSSIHGAYGETRKPYRAKRRKAKARRTAKKKRK